MNGMLYCLIFAMYTEEKCKRHGSPFLKGAKLILIVAVMIGLAPRTVRAAEERTNTATLDSKASADADLLKNLRKEVDGVEALYAAYSKTTNDDLSAKYWKAYTETNDSLVPKVFDAVRQSPNSPMAFGLLEWVVTNGRLSVPSLRPYGPQAVELLREHYTLHTNISEVCKQLGFFGDPLNQPTVEFLQIAATNNPNRAARGAATFALARLTKRKGEDMVFLLSAPTSIYTNAAAVKARAMFRSDPKGSEGVLREAEQLFQTVQSDYADVPNFLPGPGLREPKRTLGEQAAIELYDCEHLTVGKVAPDIQGEDIDGHKLKLSNFRGKVVLISFWASWCGPCMQMVPHEREIAQRLGGKPFVLIGVNGDSEKAAAKRAVAEQKMTWQSFWNNGSEGGIAGTWNVHGWPTVYLLDSTGTIRLKLDGYGGKRTDALLDAMVDQWVEQAATK